MRFEARFSMDNASFEDGKDSTESILEKIAKNVRLWTHKDGEFSGAIMDSNGNRIGSWEISE